MDVEKVRRRAKAIKAQAGQVDPNAEIRNLANMVADLAETVATLSDRVDEVERTVSRPQ